MKVKMANMAKWKCLIMNSTLTKLLRRSTQYPFASYFCSSTKNATEVTIYWKLKNNEVKKTIGKTGMSLLNLAHQEDIDLEGACGGVCACSTCHIILPNDIYDDLPEPSEAEQDMLDMAFGLTSSSRLGCQVILTSAHDGMTVKLPAATRNFYVDGHVPKPH